MIIQKGRQVKHETSLFMLCTVLDLDPSTHIYNHIILFMHGLAIPLDSLAAAVRAFGSGTWTDNAVRTVSGYAMLATYMCLFSDSGILFVVPTCSFISIVHNLDGLVAFSFVHTSVVT